MPFLDTIYPALQGLRECRPTKKGGSGTPSLPMGRGDLLYDSWVKRMFRLQALVCGRLEYLLTLQQPQTCSPVNRDTESQLEGMVV